MAEMPESFRTRLTRWGFNLHPTYRSTGGWVAYIAADWSEIRVRLPLHWRTRNYVGTMFGGSLYSAVDPFYMIMLIKRLGPEFIVWDKAATIRFKKPGRDTLHACFLVPDEELAAIRLALDSAPSVDRTYLVELADEQGVVHASIEKTIYIRRKDAPVRN